MIQVYQNASGQIRCGLHARFGDAILADQAELEADGYTFACSHFQCVARRLPPTARGWALNASHLGSCDRSINCMGCD